jgi:hypothetical protein
MHIVGLPVEWEITLADGSVLRVWADGYQEIDGYYDFGTLIDLDGGETVEAALIASRTPSNPARVIVSIARLPVAAVQTIRSH